MKYKTSTVLLSGLLCLAQVSVFACTTIIVGKGATTDGSILIAKNDDGSDGNLPAIMVKHLAQESGFTYFNSGTGFAYTMPGNLMAYKTAPILYLSGENNKIWEKAGFNDAGVGITATETFYNNPNALAVDPYFNGAQGGISEGDIPTILLPQIKTARDGVLLLGSIVEKYGIGQGEGFGVAIADFHEAWYFENASGHHWVAARVPDNSYLAAANQVRLGAINLDDSTNFLGSSDLITFAVNNHLFDPEKESFLFYNVYGTSKVPYDPTYPAKDLNYNYTRVSRLIDRYSPKLSKINPIEPNNVPAFIVPDHKLSVNDVANGLSDYYQGTESDPYTSQNPDAAFRPISVYRATMSQILQLRPIDKCHPLAIANVMYEELGMTALGIYVPFYYGADVPSIYYTANDAVNDPLDKNSAFWGFRRVDILGMEDFPVYAPQIHNIYHTLSYVTYPALMHDFEKKYCAVYSSNPVKAADLLNTINNQITNITHNAVESLTQTLSAQQRVNPDSVAQDEIFNQSNQINNEYYFTSSDDNQSNLSGCDNSGTQRIHRRYTCKRIDW